MRPDPEQLFGILNKIRNLPLKTIPGSQSSTLYQDAVTRFIFDNEQLGGPIIEVGDAGERLTPQLAFLAKAFDTHLFVVDRSEESLALTRSLLDNLNLNTHTSYHRGTLDTFARNRRLVKKPLLLAIHGVLQLGRIVEEIRNIRQLNRIPYAVALHGYSLKNLNGDDTSVGRAIYDSFGNTVNLVRIGAHIDQGGQMPGPRDPGLDEGACWEKHGSEGVILFPPGQLASDPHNIEPCSNLTDSSEALVGPEARKTHNKRFKTGFYEKYMTGTGLDVGFSGYGKGVVPILPGATGVDLDFPGYDGRTLPFPDNSQDYIFTSHVLEHIPDYRHVLRDWHRVIKTGGHVVINVPHQFLYEKRTYLPSAWNRDHKRFYTPGSLLKEIEEALVPNTYRIVHLRDNDDDFMYDIPPEKHSSGCYEIECVIRKIDEPPWRLATVSCC
jgi:hypothetical protein